MRFHRPDYWQKLPALAAAIAASVTLATGEEAPDFFDIIGKSPAEVAASMTRPYQGDEAELLIAGFVGTPMSRGHREELLEELRDIAGKESASYLQKLCLSILLEEDGRFDEALAITRTLAPAWSAPLVRQTGLLWKAGKEEEAERLAADIPDPGSQESHWLSLVASDLNRHRPEEAMRLLAFLESLDSLPPQVRHSLAIQHLAVARRAGGSDRLIATAASPALRAVWLAALDRNAEALASVAQVEPSARNIALLALALPGEAAVLEKAREFLRSDTLSAQDRLVVLKSCRDSDRRAELWIGMGGGHEETAETLNPKRMTVSSQSRERIRERCLDLLKTRPEATRLKWIAGQLSEPGTPEAKALLREVARNFRKDVESGSSDPAASALEILAKQSTPEELRELLFAARGFDNLPAEVRLRYLMAADLDVDVVDGIKACPFDQPAHDSMGSSILSYLSRRDYAHAIPDEVFPLLLDRLPDLVLGSATKVDFQRRSSASSWLTFLGSKVVDRNRLTEAAHRLVESAGQRGPGIRQQVLDGFPEFVWSLPGLKVERPEKKPATVPEPPAYRLAALFTPLDPAKFGRDPFMGGVPSGLDPALWSNPSDPTRALVNSLWTQNLRALADRKRFDPALQAKLRALFDGQPSRTIIYDLLVTAGRVECPDPAVKALAEKRVAGLVPSREDDPAIAMFLFFQRLSKGASPDDCLPLLDGLASFSKPERIGLLRLVVMDRRLGEMQDVIREKLGFGMPPGPPAPPAAPDAYDRLQFFIEAGKQASPDAVALAKDTLLAFVDSGRAELWSTENIAIGSLTTARRFDEFLGELKSRMAAAGKPELDVQRALFRLHLYRIVHHDGEAEGFAKRVFELDPADAQAAWEVLGAASREGDAALALNCLEALARESRTRLASALQPRTASSGATISPAPLALFTGERAHDLVEMLMRVPLAAENPNTGYLPYGTPSLEPLYLHVARHDPDHLMPVLRWSGAATATHGSQLLSLADKLKEMNREAAALDLLAGAFLAPPAGAADSKLRFPPKTTRVLPDANTFPLATLARSGWAKRLTGTPAFQAAPATGDGIRLSIELAADPRPETWDRLVPAFISTVPIASQAETRRQLESQAGMLPDAAALKIHLAKQRGDDTQAPATLHSLLNKLHLASEAGDRTTVTPLWTEAKPLLEKAAARDRLEFLAPATLGFASLAEPAVWREFVDAAAKTDGFAAKWTARHDDLSNRGVSPERIADLARMVLPAIQPDEGNAGSILRLFEPIATADAPDLGLLNRFRPWIGESGRRHHRRPPFPARIQWLDLLSADPAAACPVIHPHPEPDGGWSADWSLAGHRGTWHGHPSARAFPFLSGRFDLEILAGPAPERMQRIVIVPEAGVTGRVKVDLPGDAKVIAALARQTVGDIVRWSHPVTLDGSLRGQTVAFVPVATGGGAGEISATALPAGSPFGTGDATDLHLPAGSDAELARLPWEEGPAPVVSGWILQHPNSGSLRLSFRAEDGTEVGTGHLDAGDDDLDALPFWRRFKTPADLSVPADTTTVALVFDASYRDRPTTFRLADVRAVPLPPVELPAGFTTLGRIPGSVARFALDQAGNRIAVSSHRSGVGVFDFTTNKFSGWIPLEAGGESRHLAWLALSGDRLACAEITGEIHLVSLARRSARMIRKIEDLSSMNDPGHLFELSADGRFLAWRGVMAGLRIAELGDDGIAAERLLETLQLHALHFDAEKKALLAQGGENLYSLPLDGWEKAEPKVERLTQRPAWAEPFDLSGQGTFWSDEVHQVRFRTGSGSFRYHPASRSAELPSGLAGGDRDGRPFFINSFGRVMGIDTENLEGYVPPPAK